MSRAAVGLSRASDVATAVEQAVATARRAIGEEPPDFCIAFASADHREHADLLLGCIADAAGTPYVVGCSGSGVLISGDEAETGPALGILVVRDDRLRTTPFVFGGDAEGGHATGVEIGRRLTGSRKTDDLVLLWPDPLRARPDRLLGGLAESLPGVPVAGGAAAAGDLGPTMQFCGEDAVAGGVAGMRLSGDFRYRVAVSQGCRPLGAPVRVSAAHDNLLLELDTRPAYEVLRERAPDGLLDRPEAFNHLFVGRIPEAGSGARPGEYLIRNIVTADPDTGVLAIGDSVTEGDSLVLAVREGEAARRELARVATEAAVAGGPWTFGLYFNCLARGEALYGQQGVDARILAEALPGVPILGFFGNAELAPLHGRNHLFTYTGVLTLIGGGRP